MRSHRFFSQRLAFSSFTSSDITDEYLGWLNDHELMRFSRQRFRVHTRESCEEYLQRFENSPHFFWNVISCEDELQLGTVTAYLDTDRVGANVGLLIGHPGHGYGGEAFGAVMAYLFENQGIRKVTIGTLGANQAMVKIARRWEMIFEGILCEPKRCGDGFAEVNRYSILQQEWMTLKQRSQIVVETKEFFEDLTEL